MLTMNSLMSLLELCGGDDFGCSQLVVSVDRNSDSEAVSDITRDLGWVGFELLTLAAWTDDVVCTSEKWLFLGMDV